MIWGVVGELGEAAALEDGSAPSSPTPPCTPTHLEGNDFDQGAMCHDTALMRAPDGPTGLPGLRLRRRTGMCRRTETPGSSFQTLLGASTVK
ncbi:hypothetical protein E2C01_004615 [Portunus trituberculatus]|uniref:Uncharacterized protein n=1 Tax=Portunus trituberculatus TaxID=210409 RepID=A0A5B7CR65_PORTR|nr:hypothetical protein [Portunus trituberculatus]